MRGSVNSSINEDIRPPPPTRKTKENQIFCAYVHDKFVRDNNILLKARDAKPSVRGKAQAGWDKFPTTFPQNPAFAGSGSITFQSETKKFPSISSCVGVSVVV